MDEHARRSVNRCFHVDANRINASGRLEYMKQLEVWYAAGVIRLQMSESAQQEAAQGSRARTLKAYGYIYTRAMNLTPDEVRLRSRIEQILFPVGACKENERNDVDIVFNAHKYHCTLITNDGGSKKQPSGILGNRDSLSQLGIRVTTDEEAVSEVRRLIQKRDQRERETEKHTGELLPEWVGQD